LYWRSDTLAGYGFLSENSTFSARIEQEGFIFIGPKPDSIDRMGSKIGAKNLLTSPPHDGKIPVIPGYNGSDQSVEKLTAEALKIGKTWIRIFSTQLRHYKEIYSPNFHYTRLSGVA
jgi:acetyl/propionyl-CoA carboxylase alpha subunit